MAKLRAFKLGEIYCCLYKDNSPDIFVTSFIQQSLVKQEKIIYYGNFPDCNHLGKEVISSSCLILKTIDKEFEQNISNDISGKLPYDDDSKKIIVQFDSKINKDNSPINVDIESLKAAMNNRCTVIFLYNIDELSPETVLRFFAAFPFFVFDGEIHENVFHRVISGNSQNKFLKAEAILDLLRDFKKLKEEIKKGDEALRASEDNYLSIFESAANLIATVDKKGKIVDCNGKIKQVLGYDREEIIGKSIADIFHPDQLHMTYQSFKEIIKKGASYNKQYKMITKDGSHIFVNINSTPLKNEKGKITKVIAIVEDITDRRRAEEALLQSEKKYRELIDMLPDAIVGLSQGIIIYANQATYRLLGRGNPREIIGHALGEFLEIAESDHLKKYLEKNTSRRALNQAPVKVRIVRPDGKSIFIEWTSLAANFSEGHMALLMGRDVTDKEMAVNRIRESEEKLKNMAEHSRKLERQVENFGKLFT